MLRPARFENSNRNARGTMKPSTATGIEPSAASPTAQLHNCVCQHTTFRVLWTNLFPMTRQLGNYAR